MEWTSSIHSIHCVPLNALPISFRLITLFGFRLITLTSADVCRQVGFRYNAMHVAAFHGKVESGRLLLRLIADPRLVDGSDESADSGDSAKRGNVPSKSSVLQSMDILLDLLLNSPDKGVSARPSD